MALPAVVRPFPVRVSEKGLELRKTGKLDCFTTCRRTTRNLSQARGGHTKEKATLRTALRGWKKRGKTSFLLACKWRNFVQEVDWNKALAREIPPATQLVRYQRDYLYNSRYKSANRESARGARYRFHVLRLNLVSSAAFFWHVTQRSHLRERCGSVAWHPKNGCGGDLSEPSPFQLLWFLEIKIKNHCFPWLYSTMQGFLCHWTCTYTHCTYDSKVNHMICKPEVCLCFQERKKCFHNSFVYVCS